MGGNKNIRRLIDGITRPEDGPSQDASRAVKPGVNYPGSGLPHALDYTRTILIVDDKPEVIFNFLRAHKEEAAKEEFLSEFIFCWLTDKAGGRPEDFLALAKEKAPWRCIYMDGDLGLEMDGLDLIERMRRIDALKYQPAAILTAHKGFFKESLTAEQNPDVPLLAKFEMKAADVLRRLDYETENLQRATRSRLWHDVHSLVAQELGRNTSPEKVAEAAGEFFQHHHGIKAWYYRELREGKLQAIALKDAYDAGAALGYDDLPDFLKKLIDKNDTPWQVRNDLPEEDCGTHARNMAGDHCVAARLGGADSRFRGFFTLYRDKSKARFSADDARELYHLALQINTARESHLMLERQENLSGRLENILQAADSRDAASCLQRFVHEELNQPRALGGKTKTTVRLFRRGSGDLVRWTQEKTLGELGKGEGDDIEINFYEKRGKSVYVETIKEDRPNLIKNMEKERKNYVKTFEEGKLVSSLTAPMSFDGAVIGAINLEADHENAYDERDMRFLAALAKLTTASIMRQRITRFMENLATLMVHAVRVDDAQHGRPEDLLNEAAAALYRLTGFSNCILLSPPDGDVLKNPWEVAHAWQGGKEEPQLDDLAQLQKWKEKLDRQWNDSFLKKALQSGHSVSFTNNPHEMAEDDKDLRPGRPTLAQVVIRIGSGSQPKSMLSLLFEHPRPIPRSFHPVLERFADFMATVYEYRLQEVKRLGERLSVERMEARLARHFGQVRHAIANDLALLAQQTTFLPKNKGKSPEETLDFIRRGLQALERKTRALAHQALVKAPQLQPCSPAEIWNALREDFAPQAEARNIILHDMASDKTIQADERMLKAILFNLLDNVFQHGKSVRAVWLMQHDDRLCLCDDGKAPKEDIVHKTFEPGYTTAPTGSGQGLYISRAYAQDMGMELTFSRENGKNCFCLHYSATEGERHG